MKRHVVAALLAGPLLAGLTLTASAQEQTQTPQRTQQQVQNQQVYGWQLMTPQERAEYQTKMRGLKTYQERERFREEHHRLMQERAKERGVTLPEPRPYGGRGRGMGPGGGMGPRDGMRPGGGMGPASGQQ